MTRKNWLIFTLIAVLLIGGGLYWRSAQGAQAEPEGPQKIAVQVETRTIENLVIAQGALEPSQDVEIGFTVSGVVSAVNFVIGDPVKAGDILAELDPSEYEGQLKLDLANRKGLDADRRDAVSQLEAAQSELNRAEKLQKSRATSDAALESAALAVSSQKIKIEKIDVEIEKSELTIENDRNTIENLKLVVPFDGVATALPFQIGQTVSANDNAKASVSNLTKLVNRAQVAEADIAKISVGMEAYLTTLGRPNDRIEAKVTRIEPTPVNENDVVLYNVLLDLDNPDLELFDGMTTQVFFVEGQAENVPTLPLAAVTREGRESQVELPTGEMKPIETGLRDRLYIQITEGLEAGDSVMMTSSASQRRGFGGPR